MTRIGFHNPFEGAVGGGDRYLFTMLEEAARLKGAEVFVLTPERPDPAAWERVGVSVDSAAYTWAATRPGELTERSQGLDLLVTIDADVPTASAARHSVCVIQFPFRARERRRERLLAATLGVAGRRRAPAALASYDVFLCYSRFAREWIERRLGVVAEVVPPPVDPPAEPPAARREQRILGVGRFFRGAHEKRHDILIRAFRELGTEGWELHLAGGADERPQTARWLEELRALADGLPVRFHVDAPRAELLELYAGSALFWHAAGFGVREERHPERLEHFGIVTVEAMMHGTVPLVVPAGGQAEIVDDGRTGRHWRTVDDLVAATRELISDPAGTAALRSAAAAEARHYDTARFRETVRERVLSLAGSP
jgi:glycosyltransferase involved in cell wall biosynthesis